MAEPVRKPTPPLRPHPPGRVRPRRVLHRNVPVPEESEISPGAAQETAVRPAPAAGARREGAPPPRPAVEAAPLERAFASAPRTARTERKLRIPLLLVLALQAAVLLIPTLRAAGTRPELSDLLLAAAVLVSGGAMLAMGALWGRRG